jgi:5-methylcytosine-specific restriction endonuclease McrA
MAVELELSPHGRWSRVDDTRMATLTRVCFYCKRPFEAAHRLANICSPDCQKAARAASRTRTSAKLIRAEIEPSEAVIKQTGEPRQLAEVGRGCLRCGKALLDATGASRYCSRACRRAVQRTARKAKIRRGYIEAVSLTVLRDRDNGTCRICGQPVDFARRSPHPEAATIDHVVALSRGGEHSYRNTQLAHLRCNSEKGAG